jgi:hypothetical protein
MQQEENNVNASPSFDEIYNIIECAFGNVQKRHHFKRKGETIDYIGKPDQYHSTFLHSSEIISFYNSHKNEKGNKTVEGYKEKVWLNYVLIDFDIENATKQNDLIELLNNVRNFLRQLETLYELNPDYIRINFSGTKGFHIRIPSILFGQFQPSELLPDRIKELVKQLVGNFRIDESVYKHTGLFRFVNSRNSKSSLCAIPLTAKEIFTLSIEEIKALAREPREIEYFPMEELEPNEELVKLKETVFSKPSKFTANLSKVELDENDSIWLGVAEGKRNESLAKIVGYFISKRIDDVIIISNVKNWNLRCTPPEDEKIVVHHALSLIRDFSSNHNGFWSFGDDGKVYFLLVEFRKYLENSGYAKTYLGKHYTFIRVSENKIKEVSLPQIKDHVLEYVRALENPNSEKIEEAMLQKNASVLLGDDLIECIKTIDPNLVADTEDTAFLFFNNGVVSVNRDKGISISNYPVSSSLVWESQIIKKDIELVRDASDFERFIFNVSGQDTENFKAFQTAIGYLLHSYKDSSQAKVIVLCDQKVTDFPDGRTGKSLFGKAISKVKRSVRIDGKNFNFNTRFTFQQVELDTQILEFNDVKKDFDFENLFSVVTDDMTIENKRMKPFVIPFDRSPKIMASTNYTIRGMGSSYRDRLFEIEFSDYYNEQHRPIDDFGHRFFDEWDDAEWNRFYNFMFNCVLIYLQEGLVIPKNKNLEERKLIDSTSREFIDFMNDQGAIEGENKKILYNNFQSKFPDYIWLTQHKFSKWIRTYCSIKGLNLTEKRSNGKDYITISK